MTVIVNDVSEHQGAVDWAAHRAGRQAVILRAHNGNRLDRRFDANREAAASMRLVGIYQYLVEDRDPADQAEEFVDVVGRLAGNEWPILDIEEGVVSAARAQAWLDVVEPALGRKAWLYSGDDHWQTTDLRTVDRARWVARYSKTPPRTKWSLWQHASDAHAPGVQGFVDESTFPGDIEHLTHLAIGADDVPLTDADLDAVQARVRAELDRAPNAGSGYNSAMVRLGRSEGWARTLDPQALTAALDAAVAKLALTGVDPQALAHAVVAELGHELTDGGA